MLFPLAHGKVKKEAILYVVPRIWFFRELYPPLGGAGGAALDSARFCEFFGKEGIAKEVTASSSLFFSRLGRRRE